MRRKTLNEMVEQGLCSWWFLADYSEFMGGVVPTAFIETDGSWVEFDLEGRMSSIPAPVSFYGQKVRVNDFLAQFFPKNFISKWEAENRPWRFVQ